MMLRRVVVTFGLCAAMLMTALASPAMAQSGEYRVARRLGGVTTRISPPLADRAALQRLATNPRLARDLRKALADAGLSEIADDVLATMAAADASRVRDVSFPIGGRLEWMSLRRKGAVNLLRLVQWGGAAPFRAFEFTVEGRDRVYTFVVPRACGNLSLVKSEAKAAPPAPAPVPPPAPAPPPPPPPAPVAPPAPAVVAPPPAPVMEPAPVASLDRIHPFIAGYFGKERRVRDEFLGGRCAPLFGVKGGVLWDVGENWMIGPAIGVAANLRDGDNSSFFAELEANYVTASKAYIGTGIGVWDVFDGDTIAPTALINFGVPIMRSASDGKLFLTGEGRLFLNEINEIDNNYMFWGGLRYEWK